MRYFKLQSFIYVTVHVKLKGHQKLLSASALVWPSIFFFLHHHVIHFNNALLLFTVLGQACGTEMFFWQ